MATLTFGKYLNGFKSLSGALAAAGTLIPAIAYFTKYSPPFLEEASLLTAAVAAATVVFAYYYQPKDHPAKPNPPPLVRAARKLLIIAFILFILYLILLRVCTTLDPREGQQRFQIGFNRYDWSLAEEGRKLKADHPTVSIRDFMLYGRAYNNERIEVLWKPWTVYLAGVLTIIMFMFTFILWNFGWALIAKQHAESA